MSSATRPNLWDECWALFCSSNVCKLRSVSGAKSLLNGGLWSYSLILRSRAEDMELVLGWWSIYEFLWAWFPVGETGLELGWETRCSSRSFSLPCCFRRSFLCLADFFLAILNFFGAQQNPGSHVSQDCISENYSSWWLKWNQTVASYRRLQFAERLVLHVT